MPALATLTATPLDLRTQTSLIAAILALAITASVLLRARRRRVHWMFGAFGFSVAAWYLTTFVGGVAPGALATRLNLLSAIVVPFAGAKFFRSFIPGEDRIMNYITRFALTGATVMGVMVFTPLYDHIVLRTSLFILVVVMWVASLGFVWMRGPHAASRNEEARLRFLALTGGFATVFTLAEYLPYMGLDIPPVGTVLILVFLYVLSQSILQYRLLDLYELAGRLTVVTALAFTLALMFWVLVQIAEGRFFLHSVVAALVVLLLFDPVRAKVEESISQFFFRERYGFEQATADIRAQLAHVLEIEGVTQVLVDGLEGSRRVTHGAVYLVEEEQRGYALVGHTGPAPVARLEIAPARAFIDRLSRDGVLVLENLEREIDERREMGEDRDAETVFEITQTLEAMNASVCVGIRGEGSSGDLYGILCVRDERLRDAFSPEEVQLLAGLAAQAAVAVENSRLYRRLKERDRLVALGEMAAGLAHEIRNPLGAIKASAQYLHDDEEDPTAEPSPEREFLDIIVEEVDRLNWVVGSFLDYARPSKGDPVPTDVNATVLRTMQLLNAECQAASVTWKSELAEHVPKVRIDVEQLHQVLINLVRNAVQAMETGGEVTLRTRTRDDSGLGSADHFVEIRVSDTGPGIPQRVLQNLFVPFVTTKDRGTGLGLAISQRIANAASGEITVSSRAGTGTTFVVKLPVAEETALTAVSAAAEELSKTEGQAPSSDGSEAPDGREGEDGNGDEPAEPAAPSSGSAVPGEGADTARGVATSR